MTFRNYHNSGKYLFDRHPNIDRTIAMMKMLLNGSSCADIGKQFSLKDRTVKIQTNKLVATILNNPAVATPFHPFTRIKYSHIYSEYEPGKFEIIPAWIQLKDLQTERSFVLMKMEVIKKLINEYLAVKDSIHT